MWTHENMTHDIYPFHAFVSPHSRGGGGLALFWKQDVDLEILSFCKDYFDTKVSINSISFFSTFVYGEPDRNTTREFFLRFPNVYVRMRPIRFATLWKFSFLSFEGSDHRPVVTYFNPSPKRRRGLFRYDRRLRNSEEVKNLISKVWQREELYYVEEKLGGCRREIIAFSTHNQERGEKWLLKHSNQLSQRKQIRS
uniref:Endonuclease/exonuclease/phosphatase domain-containing protein n=1 Tax=Noccaea caerulescens TaxID=107243 RepID=A0A1J3II32_NOCCA